MTSMTGGCLCRRVMSRETVSSADRDLLGVNRAAIWAEIAQRNALRKSAQLPLLDEQKEFDNACKVALNARWRAFRITKQAAFMTKWWRSVVTRLNRSADGASAWKLASGSRRFCGRITVTR